MSYILDALRKADAQRARDSVRGINAPGARGLAGANAPPRFRRWYWAVAAIGVAAVALAGWSIYHGKATVNQVPGDGDVAASTAPVVVQASPRAALPAPAMASIAPVVGSVVQPPPIAPAAPTAAQVAQVQSAPPPGWPPTGVDPRNTSRPMIRGRQPRAGDVPGAMVQQPLTAPSQAAAQQPPGMEPPAMPATAPSAMAGQPMPAPLSPPVAANAPPPPPVAGLPADAPKLSITGGVYSANRAQRMLIVNGQVFSEGSEISSGVVLDEVKPKIAVLRFRGTRYTVSY